MQIYAESGKWHLPLIPIAMICILGNYQPSHSICLLLYTAIFFIGIGEEAYYNLAWSTLLGSICLLFNLQ